jgi:hypothetical protein
VDPPGHADSYFVFITRMVAVDDHMLADESLFGEKAVARRNPA